MDSKIASAGAPKFLVVCMERGSHREEPITIADEIGPRRLSESHVWLFTFGAYGNTHVAVVGNALDDALEIAAAVLADLAPGYFTELELPANFNDLDDEAQQEAHDAAEADLTLTDAGYLCSWEWSVDCLPPESTTRKRILDKIRGRVHKQSLRDYHAQHPAHAFDHTPRPKISEIEYA